MLECTNPTHVLQGIRYTLPILFLYSDAAYNGFMGAVVEFPRNRLLCHRKTNTVAYELLEASVSITCSEWPFGMRVVHVVDVTSALACLVRRYSLKTDFRFVAGRLWREAIGKELSYRVDYLSIVFAIRSLRFFLLETFDWFSSEFGLNISIAQKAGLVGLLCWLLCHHDDNDDDNVLLRELQVVKIRNFISRYIFRFAFNVITSGTDTFLAIVSMDTSQRDTTKIKLYDGLLDRMKNLELEETRWLN